MNSREAYERQKKKADRIGRIATAVLALVALVLLLRGVQRIFFAAVDKIYESGTPSAVEETAGIPGSTAQIWTQDASWDVETEEIPVDVSAEDLAKENNG